MNSPRATKPMMAHTPKPLPPSSLGLGGVGGGPIGSTVTPSTEVTLGAKTILPLSLLKDPVICLIKLFPRISDIELVLDPSSVSS